jgi:FkbM family methyltransferase
VVVRIPAAERALHTGIRHPSLRKHLRLGAIALGYPRALGKRRLRVAEMDGYRFWVNVGEPLGVLPYFFGDPCVIWFTRGLLRPGDVCMDAGANAGFYTFLFASAVGPTGRVFSFEPNPEFASMIRQSRHLNPGFDTVHVDQRALSSTSGEKKRFFLSVNPANSGTSSFVDHGVYLSADSTVNVETVTLDDFASEFNADRFRIVKIDVERAEDFVLAGARRALAEHRIDYLIVEMSSGGRAQQLLEEAGYRGFLVDHGQEKLVKVEPGGAAQFGDYLFARPGVEPPV